MRIVFTLSSLVMLAGAAQADTQAAEACKAGLSPVGQEIYTATLAQHPTPATGRDLITKEVKRLISAGTVSLSEGRAAGKAAGACLEKLE